MVNVFETVSKKLVKLLQVQDDLKNANRLIANALAKISNLARVSIKNVFVIVDPSFDTLSNIQIVSAQVQLKNGYVTKEDIDAIFKNARSQCDNEEMQIIQEHPLKFFVESDTSKTFYQAPLLVSGKLLLVKIAIASVSKKIFTEINNLLELHKLNIIQMFLTPQTLAHAFISNIAIQEGTVLVHFDATKTFVIVTKNATTIACFQINNGMQNLYEQIKSRFNCSSSKTKDLIYVYGSLEPSQFKEIIYINQSALRETRYTNNELNNILEAHFQEILTSIFNYVNKKRISHLPLIISGQTTKLQGFLSFAKKILKTNVMLYSPLQYVEVNMNNANSIGAIKGYEMMKKIYDQSLFTNKVNKNPLESFFQKINKQTFFNKLMSKLGDKYDWSN